MRAALGLLVLALLAPLAAASSFTLLADRHADQDASGGVTVFTMPVQVNQGGFVYAKVLATEGNAVNDGYHANGSVEAHTGWRVAFAWIYANGTRQELGEFVDGTPSALAAVSPESDQLVMTVRWPSDAQTVGGPAQQVWVALAYRQAPSGTDPGATSGVQMDEARAISLTLHFGPGVAMEPSGTTASPTPGPSPTPPSTVPSAPPATPTAATPQASPGGGGEPVVPSVGPIESSAPATRIVVVAPPLPSWFLGAVVFLGVVSVVSLSLLAVGVWLLARRRREAPVLRRVTRIPVRLREETPASPPVRGER